MTTVKEMVYNILEENPNTSITEIASELKYSYSHVYTFVKQYFAEHAQPQVVENPKSELKGFIDVTPFGKVYVQHGNYYVRKPAWYTAGKTINYVLLKNVIYCHTYGFSKVPRGYIIIFKDGDASNVDVNNLTLQRKGMLLPGTKYRRSKVTTEVCKKLAQPSSVTHSAPVEMKTENIISVSLVENEVRIRFDNLDQIKTWVRTLTKED